MSLPQIIQKDAFCFFTFSNISLCSFLTREGLECRDMKHCIVATLLSLNRDTLLPAQIQVHCGKETAV